MLVRVSEAAVVAGASLCFPFLDVQITALGPARWGCSPTETDDQQPLRPLTSFLLGPPQGWKCGGPTGQAHGLPFSFTNPALGGSLERQEDWTGLNRGLKDSQARSQGWRAVWEEETGAGQGVHCQDCPGGFRWESAPPPARGVSAIPESKSSSPMQLVGV